MSGSQIFQESTNCTARFFGQATEAAAKRCTMNSLQLCTTNQVRRRMYNKCWQEPLRTMATPLPTGCPRRRSSASTSLSRTASSSLQGQRTSGWSRTSASDPPFAPADLTGAEDDCGSAGQAADSLPMRNLAPAGHAGLVFTSACVTIWRQTWAAAVRPAAPFKDMPIAMATHSVQNRKGTPRDWCTSCRSVWSASGGLSTLGAPPFGHTSARSPCWKEAGQVAARCEHQSNRQQHDQPQFNMIPRSHGFNTSHTFQSWRLDATANKMIANAHICAPSSPT